MYLILQTPKMTTSSFSIILTIITIIGFVAATFIGSMAWYNSKKPIGWENKDTPNFIPKIDKN